MISAVVLTHNDEATVAKTLKSLTWCDETIVVDDVSTDTTVAIVKKFTDKIFRRSLDGNFAQQRNFGLSKAKGDWVVFIDSDEVVPEELAKEIQHVIPAKAGIHSHSNAGSPIRSFDPELRTEGSEMTGHEGFFVKRRDFMWGKELKHGEQGNMKLLRLAKKDAGQWERPVHEVWEIKGPVGELKEPLFHFPHPSVAQYLEEMNRYSTLNASFLYKQGVHVHWWQIAAYPAAKFFLNYGIRFGFLDGTAGAVVAIMMSLHSFLTRAKLWQLWDTQS